MVGRGTEPAVMIVFPIFTPTTPEKTQMSPASTLSTWVSTISNNIKQHELMISFFKIIAIHFLRSAISWYYSRGF
jgi:hypothetical protein